MKSTTRTTRNTTPPKSLHTSSAKEILGANRGVARIPVEESRPGPRICYVCQVKLTAQRVEALRGLGTPIDSWMCVKCSSNVTSPRLGIYMGEVGTSELKIVDKIYNDSVRDIFMEGSDDEETDKE